MTWKKILKLIIKWEHVIQQKNEKNVEVNQKEEPVKAKALPNSANRAVEAQPKTEETKKFIITIKEDSTLLLEEEFDEKTLLKDVYSKIEYDTLCDYDLIDIKSEERLNEKVTMSLKEIFPSNDQVSKIELLVKYTGMTFHQMLGNFTPQIQNSLVLLY